MLSIPLRYPKRLVRALLAIAIGLVVHSIWDRLRAKPIQADTLPSSDTLDYGWGTSIHRFHNHPENYSSNATPFPWTLPLQTSQHRRIWIVTNELDGLHKNGGIGTAYAELAKHLSQPGAFQVAILIPHEEKTFTWRQRQQVMDQ